MEMDYIERRREEEVRRYETWSGAAKVASARLEPDVREEANKIISDVRSGLSSGAGKVVIDNSNLAAVELAKTELTEDELAKVEFSDR